VIGPKTPDLPELTSRNDIRTAQVELRRLGCFVGSANGQLTDNTTIGLETAERSLGNPGRSLRPLTSEVLAFLKSRKEAICTGSVACGPGQAKRATTCVASIPPQQPTRRARAVETDDEKPAARRAQRPPPSERTVTPVRPAPRTGTTPSAPSSPAPRPTVNITM
jgi:hypothetical protein